MSWLVIREFADKTDNYHVYKAGDSFPRDGKQVSTKRTSELSTNSNAQGVPLIKEVLDEGEAAAKPVKTKSRSKKSEE